MDSRAPVAAAITFSTFVFAWIFRYEVGPRGLEHINRFIGNDSRPAVDKPGAGRSMISASTALRGVEPTSRDRTLRTSSRTTRRQYKNPVRIVGFNVAERCAHDVSKDVAEESSGAAICS